jgi:hypothetical protein
MHLIQHRLRHHRLKHLPGGRHIMHLVEDEFLRRRDTGEQRDMRNDENDDSDNAACDDRNTASRDSNVRQFGHEFHNVDSVAISNRNAAEKSGASR